MKLQYLSGETAQELENTVNKWYNDREAFASKAKTTFKVHFVTEHCNGYGNYVPPYEIFIHWEFSEPLFF